MNTTTHSILLKSVVFQSPKFRKLENLTIDLSERITIISGHNGIGKSTILGLIANGSGNKSVKYKSYFDLPFQANFHELFSLSEDFDYVEKYSDRPFVLLNYNFEYEKNDEKENEILTKKCNVTKHWDKKLGKYRLKVVPRTLSPHKNLGKLLNVSQDGRIPLPTIYLGMSRISPIGEHDEGTLSRDTVKSFNEKDSEFFRACIQSVVNLDIDETTNTMLSHSFKGSKKRSKIPSLEHDSLAISLGQDSLSTITTALTSFKKLKKEIGDKYIGGVLIIDEIEAGLHPHAQIKLIKILKKQARSLNLQIIATSHSLTIIKEILKIDQSQKDLGRILDSVVYLTNSKNPLVLKSPTYQKIKDDMLLIKPDLNKNQEEIIKIYFEDNEALYFFEKILSALNLSDIKDFGVQFQLIPAKIGCSTLLSLAEADDYFKNVIVIFDNDVFSQGSARTKIADTPTYCCLPSPINMPNNTPPEERTPERMLYRYIEKLVQDRPEEFWEKTISLGYNQDQIEEHILTLDFQPNSTRAREFNEKWFADTKEYFDSVNLVSFWTNDHLDAVEPFIEKLKLAIRSIQNHKSTT